jgi:hypothetical protein
VLALIVSVLFGLYALGPDLVARWVLGFVVPRKNIVQSKSEEITRGILWAAIPLLIVWSTRHWGPLHVPDVSKPDLQVLFSGLYSESYFKEHSAPFFLVAGAFARANARLLLRLYVLILLVSGGLDFAILRYGRLRHWLNRRGFRWIRPVLAVLVLPRISEWHVSLSPILLPSKDLSIRIDVMTKRGVLYDGSLKEKMLAGDGTLHSLTLEEPRRFKFDQFVAARKDDATVKKEKYWVRIPGESFVILGGEVETLNIRHAPDTVGQFKVEYHEVLEALKSLGAKVSSMPKKPS